jgi:CRP/FNR family transcriptional regulator, cyclic AMP receptor protein
MRSVETSAGPGPDKGGTYPRLDQRSASGAEITVPLTPQTSLASLTLGSIPLFATLDADELRALELRCIWRKVDAGRWVIDAQSDGADVYFVIRGRVRVVIGTSCRNLIVRDIQDGEYFGEYSAIDGRPRSASIFAIVDTLVARMPAKVFRETIRCNSEVCDEVLTTLAASIRALNDRLNEQAHYDVRQRICAEILRLARRSTNGRIVVSPPPTHEELAARVGSQRETVTKLLNELERNGAIARVRGALVLTEPERLQDVVAKAQ